MSTFLHRNCTQIWGKNIAVDANWQDEQIGTGMLKDDIQHTIIVA